MNECINEQKVKVSDDELRDSQGAAGTPLWMSPEVLEQQPFTEKVDVYSFALVLWELLTRRRPYAEVTTALELRQHVCVRQLRPPIPRGTNARMAALLEACWSSLPRSRPAFHQIVRQLDYIIIEHAIQGDIDAQTLWKEAPFCKLVRTINQERPQCVIPTTCCCCCCIDRNQSNGASSYRI